MDVSDALDLAEDDAEIKWAQEAYTRDEITLQALEETVAQRLNQLRTGDAALSKNDPALERLIELNVQRYNKEREERRRKALT